MYPILIDLGPLPIRMYGFFVALGFIVGIWIARREAKRYGDNPDDLMDLAFYVILSAIIGSRLFYVITEFDLFKNDPIKIFKIWEGGLVFYGGFIGVVLVFAFYVKKVKMDLWKTADISTPSIAIGHGIARMGCFFAGCCYGKPCDLPWAITFTNPLSVAPLGIPLHPSQIYSVINNLFIFIFIMWFRKHTKFKGQLFWTYVILYAITRSIIELFRDDPRGSILGIVTTSQAVAIVMVITSITMMFILSKRAGNK